MFTVKRIISLVLVVIAAFGTSASTAADIGNLPIYSTYSGGEYLTLSKKSSSSTYVAEIIRYNAETFSGNTSDDYSKPYNSFLPRGTVDYCDNKLIKDKESGKTYYKLKCGMRVYAKKSEVKVKKGKLKSTKNTVELKSVKTSGNRTRLALSLSWKAPFMLDLNNQKFPGANKHNYYISSATFKYVDIKFCYANKVKGKIDLKGNPLFYKYKWTKKSDGYSLRLYLRKTAGFYGWNSYYNYKGELVFSFLNPPTLYKAKNKYGYSLKGTKIWVDAGHGGKDGGTYVYSGKKTEKYYTLQYAKDLASNLKKLGAKVVMSRDSDKTVELWTRYTRIQASEADFGVSIHFDGNTSSKASGYFVGYYNQFSYNPAKIISNKINSKKHLPRSRKNGVDFHYFNLSRTFTCPFLLTENGFLTGKSDFNKIKSSSFRKKYVDTLTDGIMEYFIKNKGAVIDPQKGKNNSSSSSSSNSSSKNNSSKNNSSKNNSSSGKSSSSSGTVSSKTNNSSKSSDSSKVTTSAYVKKTAVRLKKIQ